MENITGNNWHFLTGSEKNIKALSDQVGFRFQWNEKQKQFAHLPVAYVLTPKGRISRYLYGVEIEEKNFKTFFSGSLSRSYWWLGRKNFIILLSI